MFKNLLILILAFNFWSQSAFSANCGPVLDSNTEQVTEPEWSKELLVKLLQQFWQDEYTPNYTFFKRTKASSEWEDYIENVTGIRTTLFSIFQLTTEKFGSHKEAVIAAGLPVDEIYNTKKKRKQKWDKKLVYKCLRGLYEAGYKPKVSFLQTNKDSEPLNIIENLTGFSTSLYSLLQYSKELHEGDHNAALKAAELPLDEILEIRINTVWNKELIYYVLRALYAEGFIPSASVIQKPSQEINEFVWGILGFETAVSRMYYDAAEMHDGSYARAIIAAGLPYDEVVKKTDGRLFTKELTHKALKALYKRGYHPSYTFVFESKNEKARDIVSEAVGFPTSLRLLGEKVQDFHYGNYQKGLDEAGIHPYLVVDHLNTEVLNEDFVLKALRLLYRNGFIPSAKLMSSSNQDAMALIKRELGADITLRSIQKFISRSNWKNLEIAVEQAGLDFKKIIRHREGGPHFSKDRILEVLKAFKESDFVPYRFYLEESQNPMVHQIWQSVAEDELDLIAIFNIAELEFEGGFEEALTLSGFDPEKILKRKQSKKWEKEVILGALKYLFENGLRPNSTLLMNMNVEIRAELSKYLGFWSSGVNLYKFSRIHFGSLRGALLAAKLPAHEILKRASKNIDYSIHMDTQVERIEENGEVSYQKFIGRNPEQPLQIIERMDLKRVLEDILPEDLLAKGLAIIEILQSYDLEDIGIADIALLTEEDEEIALAEVAKIMSYLSSSEELKELLVSEE